jgi:DNA-binding HxlR family transcriptional regulator
MEHHRSFCPINLSMEILGDKWSLLIIRDIMFAGKRYFRELLHSEEKIATNILTERLAMLEREGIISKSPDPDHKQKIIYSVTQKGIDLVPVYAGIAAWSLKYLPVDIKKYRHAVALGKADTKALTEIKKNLARKFLG